MIECAKSAMMPDSEISKGFDIPRGVEQGWALPLTLFEVFIDGLITAIEAAKQGAQLEEDMVSRLIFADDFVWTSETPKRLQRKIDKALGNTREGRVAAVTK